MKHRYHAIRALRPWPTISPAPLPNNLRVSNNRGMNRITVIDSHAGREPTHVVLAAWADLGAGPLADRARRFRDHFDAFRSRVVNEPRGSDVLVGALLVGPHAPGCAAGVIFFNNVGTIGMCGHGTIGLVVTLAHRGRIKPGQHRIETPVGTVTATLEANGEVTVQNVPSWRAHKAVSIEVEGKVVKGDIAWGGNWFFLVQESLTDIRSEERRVGKEY